MIIPPPEQPDLGTNTVMTTKILREAVRLGYVKAEFNPDTARFEWRCVRDFIVLDDDSIEAA